MVKDMILSLSGGLDSSSLLFEFHERIQMVVNFDYGSTQNESEKMAVRRIAEKADVPLRIINVSNIFSEFRSILISGGGKDFDWKFDDNNFHSLVVPFRNGIFLSILAGIAESVDAKFVALANHAGDHKLCPDCRPLFTKFMGDAIKFGTSNNVEFFAPYVNISKHEVAVRGIKAGLNPDWTYSCYKGDSVPCGVCPACIEREEALEGLNW